MATQIDAAKKTNMVRMGLWLFVVSDSFVFIGLLTTRMVLLGNTRPDLNQALGLVVTIMLLLSSFFMNRAETHIKHGNQEAFVKNLTITLILGVAFLLGVVAIEWPQAVSHGITTRSGQAGAVFFIMTGFHAVHVLTGVLYLFAVLRNGRNGLYTKERHFAVEAAAIYWHFIDVAWIFFYPALYLIGTAIHG